MPLVPALIVFLELLLALVVESCQFFTDYSPWAAFGRGDRTENPDELVLDRQADLWCNVE